MPVPLNDALKEFYESKSLNSEQLRRLKSLEPKKRNFIPWGKVAFLAMSLGLVVWIQLQMGEMTSRQQGMAEEVAASFMKNMPVEIHTNSLQSVSNQLSKLDFRLVVPFFDWEQIGARYCKVEGQLAAQLAGRVQGKSYGLFQVKDSIEFQDLSLPWHGFASGNAVSIWRDKGVLLFLVGSEHLNPATYEFN